MLMLKPHQCIINKHKIWYFHLLGKQFAHPRQRTSHLPIACWINTNNYTNNYDKLHVRTLANLMLLMCIKL